jgi:hypothetical protein
MDTSSLIPVRVGACLCPGAPHADGDFVYLRPKLGLAAGIILQQPVVDWLQLPKDSRPGHEFMRGELADRYLTLGIAEWNLTGEDGPLPVNPLSIREQLLDDYERGSVAAEAADDLYSEVALVPLARLVSISSRPTSSNGSTSVRRNGSPKPRKRSKPSSTSTTPTAVTETTLLSPAGDSKS